MRAALVPLAIMWVISFVVAVVSLAQTDKPPDLTDAEIVQVVKHLKATDARRQALQKEQTDVVKKVNEMPEVKALAAHQKALVEEDKALDDALLKAHSLDPAKWTVDHSGLRFVPIQQAPHSPQSNGQKGGKP